MHRYEVEFDRDFEERRIGALLSSLKTWGVIVVDSMSDADEVMKKCLEQDLDVAKGVDRPGEHEVYLRDRV